jgi:hypothetical protein
VRVAKIDLDCVNKGGAKGTSKVRMRLGGK